MNDRTRQRNGVPTVSENTHLRVEAPGRRSGRPHSATLWYVEGLGGSLELLAHRTSRGAPDWLRNAEAAGRADIEVGGAVLRGRLIALPDGEIARVVEAFGGKYDHERVQRLYGEGALVAVRVELEATLD